MIYIFNNAYRLSNDVNRIMLVSNQGEDANLFLPVHPMYGIIFSVFNGERDLDGNVKYLSDIFSMSEENVLDIIRPFLENETEIAIKYDGITFRFPTRILVKDEGGKIREDISPITCMIPPPYDFKSIRANVPKRILFVLNLNCVTDCFYCYANRTHKYIPLPTARILEIIDEAMSIGVVSFDLSGGEVLLHPDWERILQKLFECGYKPYISTKVPVREDIVKRLKGTGITQIQISIDTLDEVLLVDTLNVNHQYAAQICNSINIFDRYGFDIILKSTLTKFTCNIENVRQLLEFAGQLKNIKRYTCSSVGYSHYKGAKAFKEMIPSIAAVNILSSFLKSASGKYAFDILDDLNAPTCASMNNYLTFKRRSFCSGNLNSLTIMPDGKATICEEIYWNENLQLGDLSHSSIMDVWQSDRAKSLFYIKQKMMPDNSPCAICRDFDTCRHEYGVCWKDVIAAYGDENWLLPDPRCPFAPEPFNDVYYG